MASSPALVVPLEEEDPVRAAVLRAPLDEIPETEEERRAVQAAKMSGRMLSHARIESMIDAWRKSE